MNIIDVVIIALVVAFFAVGVRRFVGTAVGKRDCCSGKKEVGTRSSGASASSCCCHKAEHKA